MASIFRPILFFALLFLIRPLQGQSVAKKPIVIEQGFIVGAGYGIDSRSLPEGKYIPVLVMGHIGLNLRRHSPTADARGNIFTMYLEPQINPVFVRNAEKTVNDLEFGVNLGFKHMFRLYQKLYSYVLIGFGPHYATVHTTRQARGFIFSDNLGTGVYLLPGKTLAFNLGFRLRHLSNAELKKPNQGINTFNFIVGVTKLLR